MKSLAVLKSSVVIPEQDPAWVNEIPKDMKLRAPRIWRMARVAVDRLLKDSGSSPRSVICATALGALDETRIFLDGIYTDGFGSPKSFIASVHNSMAGKLGIDFKITGPNLTVCDGHNSFASALVAAALLREQDFPAVLLVVDEKIELIDTVLPHFSQECRAFLQKEWQEAAVAFLLDFPTSEDKPALCGCGPVAAGEKTPAGCIEELAKKNCRESILLPLSETATSFVKPALAAHSLLSGGKKGTYALGSFSPTARAAAIVTVCI
jgi:hypothetical protein